MRRATRFWATSVASRSGAISLEVPRPQRQLNREGGRMLVATPSKAGHSLVNDSSQPLVHLPSVTLTLASTYEEGEFLKLQTRCEAVANLALKSKEGLHRDFRGWKDGEDARLGLFARFYNQLSVAASSAGLLNEYLSKPEWWEERLGKPIPPQVHRIRMIEFSQFIKIGLLHQTFSAIETALRVFLRSIDPKACGGGTDSFKSVYDCLLTSKMNLPADDIALLDLLRNLRNLVHNGGVFMSRRGTNSSVLYRGKTYDFTHADIVQFASWYAILEWVSDLIALADRVVRDPHLRGRPSPLADPAATILTVWQVSV